MPAHEFQLARFDPLFDPRVGHQVLQSQAHIFFFKGEKARVQNIDEAKEEITVELFEAMISIPITVRGDHVRVIEKELK